MKYAVLFLHKKSFLTKFDKIAPIILKYFTII